MKTSLNQRRAVLITQMSNLTANNPEYKQDAAELAKINANLDSMMKDLRAKAAAAHPGEVAHGPGTDGGGGSAIERAIASTGRHRSQRHSQAAAGQRPGDGYCAAANPFHGGRRAVA